MKLKVSSVVLRELQKIHSVVRRNLGQDQHDTDLRAFCHGDTPIEKIPAGRWQTTTFLGALRATGFIAPLTMDGPINGALFIAWVEQHLAPLQRRDDIVVMDNLSSHAVKGVRTAIEAGNADLWYLPPYSPDLNQIELAFSKLKKLLRDGAERTMHQLWKRCGTILKQFSQTECRNDFKHCGCRHT